MALQNLSMEHILAVAVAKQFFLSHSLTSFFFAFGGSFSFVLVVVFVGLGFCGFFFVFLGNVICNSVSLSVLS